MTSLAQLTDASLHCELKRLVGRSNTLVAQLLAHLGEVESRGIHRERACASLYAYCIYELLMSEDEAQRRCRAARLARQFPLLLDMLAEASLHLTGLLLIGPHLTEENHAELLARARFRTKREIERLVAQVAPCRDVPSQIVPLHCTSAADSVSPLDDDATPGSLARPRTSWAAYVRSLAGAVRQMEPGLAAGQAPPRASDEQAAESTLRQAASAVASNLESNTRAAAISDRADDVRAGAPPSAIDDRSDVRTGTPPSAIDDRGDVRTGTRTSTIDDRTDDVRPSTRTAIDNQGDDMRTGTRTAVRPSTRTAASDNQGDDMRTSTLIATIDGASTPSPHSESKPAASVPAPAELRYKVQFTADQAYVDLLEEARNLLQHQLPTRDLVEVQRRALELLVRKLRQHKYAASERPRQGAPEPAPGAPTPEPKATCVQPPAPDSSPRAKHSAPPSAPAQPPAPDSAPHDKHSAPKPATPARHSARKSAQQSRYIPAAVRRCVWQRDEARCTYIDVRGQRCREQSGLEFHHQHPHARRGPASIENLTLRCHSHNALAAEQDFGRDVIREKRRAARAKPIRAGAAR